jgi:hypothetical protein
MFTGTAIFSRAATLLNDAGHVRWPLPELCEWLNDGVNAIVLAKPSASSLTTALRLDYGTHQVLKIDEEPKPVMLLSILRNITDTAKPYVGGRTVRRVDRALLDSVEPEWHNRNIVQFRKEVRQFVYDELTPLEYWVYPGNDGSGCIEAELSVLPPPLVATGSITDSASYATPIGLLDLYSGPLLDYVLYRCQLKDDIDGAAGRSAVHYQQFASALGIKLQVEQAHTPNARR